jgi:cytochrome c-type biogenesis protein
MTITPALPAATFAAGLISFLSPCVLPLVPGYVSIITGTSVADLRQPAENARAANLKHALAFVLGFTVIFIAFGLAAGAFGSVLSQHQSMLETGFGLLVILFGLQMTGLIRVPVLMREARLHSLMNGGGLSRSFVTGSAFGFGWTPCVGPVLGTVLALAATQSAMVTAAALLAVYSAGLAIPFLLTALSVGKFIALYKRMKAPLAYLNVASGLMLVATGALLMTHHLARLSLWMNDIPLFHKMAERFL